MKKRMQKHLLIFTFFTCTGSYVLAPEVLEISPGLKEAENTRTGSKAAQDKLEADRTARDEAKDALDRELAEHKRLSKNIKGMDPLERKEHLKDSQARIKEAQENLETSRQTLNESFTAAREAEAKDIAAQKEALKIKSRASNPGVLAFSFEPEESQPSSKPAETDPVKKAKEAIKKLETESQKLSKRLKDENKLLYEEKESSQTKQILKDTGRTAEAEKTFLKENAIKLFNRIQEITKELEDAKKNLTTAKHTVSDNYAKAKKDAVHTKEKTRKSRNAVIAEQMKAELAFDRASSAFKQNNKLAVEIRETENLITKALTPEEKTALKNKKSQLEKQVSDNTKNLSEATGRLHRAKLAMKGQAAPIGNINY